MKTIEDMTLDELLEWLKLQNIQCLKIVAKERDISINGLKPIDIVTRIHKNESRKRGYEILRGEK